MSSGRFSGRSVLRVDIPFRAGRRDWNGETFAPGVALAPLKCRSSWLPLSGSGRSRRFPAGEPANVCALDLLFASCSGVAARWSWSERGMSRRRTNCRLGAGDEWPCSASQGYAVTAQSLGRSVESRLVCIRREWSPPCESAFHQPASRWAAPISTWPHRHPPASRIGFRPRSWTTATGSLRLMMLVSPG